MNKSPSDRVPVVSILRLSRPLILLFSAFTYLLGAGVARYLGHATRLELFWLGLVWVGLAWLVTAWLTEYFRPFGEPILEAETRGGREYLMRILLLLTAAGLLGMAAIIAVILRTAAAPLVLLIPMFLTVLLCVIYGLPPVRLVNNGYGELALGVLLADLFPVLAFQLQSGGSVHRLLLSVVFPLTFLALAYFIALGFPAFAGDVKFGRHSLLTRLGWERGVLVHHLCVAMAYLLFAAAPLLGFPLALFWRVFLTLPLGLLQIYWLNRIAAGAPPVWNFLTALAASLFGLAVYLLALTFWLR